MSMGPRRFSRCDLVERFTHSQISPRAESGEKWLVYDWDQPRAIDFYVPSDANEDFDYKSIARCINELPPDVVQVEFDKKGTLVSSSSEPQRDRSWVPYYPLRTKFPRRIVTVRRRDSLRWTGLG